MILGEVFCYQVCISLDILCVFGLIDWEGGNFWVIYYCEQDSLKWKIENIGFGLVSIFVFYEFNIVNDDIVFLQSGGFEVLLGEFILFVVFVDFIVYLLEVVQLEGYFLFELICFLVQGCLVVFDIGLVSVFFNDNGNIFEVE